jgi:hypothetical protein
MLFFDDEGPSSFFRVTLMMPPSPFPRLRSFDRISDLLLPIVPKKSHSQQILNDTRLMSTKAASDARINFLKLLHSILGATF